MLIGAFLLWQLRSLSPNEGAPLSLSPKGSKQKKLGPPGAGKSAAPALGQDTESARLTLCGTSAFPRHSSTAA